MKAFSTSTIRLALALVLALAGATAAFAQVTTGSISGTVSDQDGGRLPGVTVTAGHQPTGTTYATTTDDQGRFKFPSVRVGGPYTITAELEGFKTSEVEDATVNLGREARVEFTLELGQLEETVTVVGEIDNLFGPSRTGAASNVSAIEVEALPTIERGLADFARTNPFMTVAQSNDGPSAISVAGRNNRYNNIQIDGAVNNDLFGLAAQGTPGGQADATPSSRDASQEFEPLLVMALTLPPENPPWRTSYSATTSSNSWMASRLIGVASAWPPGVHWAARPNRTLLNAPSIWMLL
jgi:hypothetical protein